MKNLLIAEFVILLSGTIFAWYNFFQEFTSWTNQQACTVGCSAGLENPFLSPCFFGAIVFTISLVLSGISLKTFSKKN